jgi:pectinesterase
MRRRHLLIATLALPVGTLLAATRRAPIHADALVSLHRAKASDPETFKSIAAALAAAPGHSDTPFRIRIDAGVWTEKLVIDKPNIHLIGDERAGSTIRFDAAAGQRDQEGEPWGTWGCATVRVTAPGFVATDLGIANGFDYLGHLFNPKLETIGSNGAQAVALMLDHGSDHTHLNRCTISGHQDTVFVDAGRSTFRDCRISGSVDFIFGAGQSLFDHCEIISRFRPGKPRQGYIAAPSTLISERYGLIFRRCRLRSEANVPAGSVALGRAWRPTREFPDGRHGDPDAIGAAVFIECHMARHVAPEGWDAMKYTNASGARVELRPWDARFGEYANHGPGALLHNGRPQLSAQQAHEYLGDDLLS